MNSKACEPVVVRMNPAEESLETGTRNWEISLLRWDTSEKGRTR